MGVYGVTSGVLGDGQAAFDRGAFFEAHERWEDVWRMAAPPERAWIQGLIQVAAGLLKLARHEPRPGRRLLAKALAKLRDAPAALHGADVSRVRAAAEDALANDVGVDAGPPAGSHAPMALDPMEQLAGMDVDVFSGIVLAAVAVAHADGMVDTRENKVLTDTILEITGGHFSYVDIQRIIDAALAEVVGTGVDASIARAAQRIVDEPTGAVAMIFAAAVAWAARGVSAAERARLDRLAGLLHIVEPRYGELLSAGRELAGRA